jgi:glycerol-3-phosphate dehydrogenase
LIAQEWVRCAQDVLWRRTKAGLHVRGVMVDRLEQFMRGHTGSG